MVYSNDKKYSSNTEPFSDVVTSHYGRKVIYTNVEKITRDNILDELKKALTVHTWNRNEIVYLDGYYRGDQPINYRKKLVRPEINNKICENHAFEIVERKTAELFGEPIQYVIDIDDKDMQGDIKDGKTNEITRINKLLKYQSKGEDDISIGRWRSICGTAYRYVWNVSGDNDQPFAMQSCDPRDTFIVYYTSSGKRPAFSCQIRLDKNEKEFYFIHTESEVFKIEDNTIKSVNSGGGYTNGIGAIPVIEYPNNERRLSDIEIVISILDAMNTTQSDRINGTEQFIQALTMFKNCEVSDDAYKEMRASGVVKIKASVAGTDVDVKLLTAELNQTQTQVVKDDLYNNMLLINGMSGRQENSGGDTGQAVVLRNGHYDAEKRAEISEPIFKRAEKELIKIIVRIMKTKQLISQVNPIDIDIKITRSKMDNMQVKAQVAQMLLDSGFAPHLVTKVCNLFSDPEGAYIESKPFMDAKYFTKEQIDEQATQETSTLETQTVN